eukprot:CAMPEP_0201888690 /NCGR_PEP_ID=MMETSP0902-20130614/28209_1 /ASSEMBLY_ACC=CAM_ASM_000551 /TAXON_ID=420261 /ORGANISM="Thalassiosira antarctica, Strain CCMP982" /LENGTH=44 /DNA_ID= /DNA_START= /DNA_END= /DNA_ORIENTATION=
MKLLENLAVLKKSMQECCVVSFPGPLGLVWACWLEDLSFLVDPA